MRGLGRVSRSPERIVNVSRSFPAWSASRARKRSSQSAMMSGREGQSYPVEGLDGRAGEFQDLIPQQLAINGRTPGAGNDGPRAIDAARRSYYQSAPGFRTHTSRFHDVPSSHNRLIAAARGIGRALRDGWLIVGLTILAFVLFEYGYRAQAGLRRRIAQRSSGPPVAAPPHPYANEPWWRTWLEVRQAAVIPAFDAYRGWWPRAHAGPNLTIDAQGRRLTTQPPPKTAQPRRVFMFGGSVMWGYTVRDSFTIPSLLARELRARGVDDVVVENYSQLGLVTTQEVITLLLLIRGGNVPHTAVFLDGLNDVTTAFQSGAAGRVENEPTAAELWTTARAGWRGHITSIARHSELLTRIAAMTGRKPTGTPVAPKPSMICDSVAFQYRQNTRSAQALGTRFGFAAVYFWQPILASSPKPKSAFERAVSEGPPGLGETLRECDAVAARVMDDRTGVDFFSLQHIYDGDSTTAFLDPYGHLTERANGVVARRMADVLAPLLATGARSGGARDGSAPSPRR